MLEVEEAAKSISMGLSLHHGESLLVVSPLTMHWTSSDMQLLVLAVFDVLLVLHMLEVLEILVLLLIGMLCT